MIPRFVTPAGNLGNGRSSHTTMPHRLIIILGESHVLQVEGRAGLRMKHPTDSSPSIHSRAAESHRGRFSPAVVEHTPSPAKSGGFYHLQASRPGFRQIDLRAAPICQNVNATERCPAERGDSAEEAILMHPTRQARDITAQRQFGCRLSSQSCRHYPSLILLSETFKTIQGFYSGHGFPSVIRSS